MSQGTCPATWTVREVLAWTADHLAAHGSGTGRLDADLLLAHALGVER
nr:peptide chain release factor N(5)-glutamine methyltransferase [Gammaproteobacteria bacterium]NIP79796.1 peptide chain release factor N(5)-glutamine methyltransferase [Gemmatimonadota bacterium]NIW35916.1 peptide chain release factor N(5)-glutamine methyltransferase [Gemmatimonadota bacterium]NIX44713.1 peptide chain release factor N(5)-glutamine methyltransferase [Gemmatimonadota bacterium]NIY08943.1 peptide chain release factor N(5)-glutamine methyltransferase [Gemmatimonadota bacterium]